MRPPGENEFYTPCSICILWCFLTLRLRLMHRWEGDVRGICSSQFIRSWGTWCQLVVFLMMLTLVTWLRGWLPVFLTIQLPFSPVLLNKHLFWERYLETMQIPCFSLNLSPTDLSTSPQILPAATTAMCVYVERLFPSFLPHLSVGILL